MRIITINIDDPEDARLRAEPDLLGNVGFSPNFCSRAGGAVRGAKAEEEFGEARAALIRLARPSRCSRSQKHDADPQIHGQEDDADPRATALRARSTMQTPKFTGRRTTQTPKPLLSEPEARCRPPKFMAGG